MKHNITRVSTTQDKPAGDGKIINGVWTGTDDTAALQALADKTKIQCGNYLVTKPLRFHKP